jgi:hypothetical protein
MSDSLRDRIAKVLMADSFGMTTPTAAYRQADAVIRELHLETVEDWHGRTTHNG